MLGDADDAADAAQDAFMTALRKLEGFRGDAAFTTWMHRVTVNACYDLLRKRRRQPLLRVAADAELPRRRWVRPCPTTRTRSSGTRDAAEALRRVPEEFRVALVLADVQDLAYDEIARDPGRAGGHGEVPGPPRTDRAGPRHGSVEAGEPGPASRASQEKA